MATFNFNSPMHEFQPQNQIFWSTALNYASGIELPDQHCANLNVASTVFEAQSSLEYPGWTENHEEPTFKFDRNETSGNGPEYETSVSNEWIGIQQWPESQIDEIPEPYRKVVIQYGKSGLPQINFHQYNRTGFCGLQDCSTDAFPNAMIQALYFQEAIRDLVLSHSCNVDPCLVCELSFLFHKMDQSPGFVCQSNNFQRAIRTSQEALALGLVLTESSTSIDGFTMIGLVQTWNRFMLEQFHAIDDRLLGKQCEIQAVKVTKCASCKGCLSVEYDNDNVCNLTYPTGSKKTHFEDVLVASLNCVGTKPSWCGLCRHFQMANQRRQIQCLPSSLTVNTGLDQGTNLEFWRDQCAQLVTSSKGGNNESGQSWIPERLTLRQLANGHLKGGSDDLSPLEREEILEDVQYELHTVCSTIVDPGTGQALNVVAAINVGDFYHARVGSPVSQWYLFNDFSIDPINVSEARRINLEWQVPTSLVYRRQMNRVSSEQPQIVPVSTSSFGFEVLSPTWGHGSPLTFLPLAVDEVPSAGDLVALDAEFVTLKPEQKSLVEDGCWRTVRLAQRAVARVTCLRGQGPMTGVPFVDDYISCQEEIFDHVTEYSGIYPGDLDPTTSTKYLTSMKTTYKRIRYLVDAGCIFVGHGLKNDFDMLNIVVPVEQVVDTVHLFQLPNRRLLSLKFLAWYFLDKIIQVGTHDPTEDAATALELFQRYREFEALNNVPEVLCQLYKDAQANQWRVPRQL
ncbi:PAN2-PAN3 deadenylation complex catalytic subunit PAN2-like [Tigriopus californicus]|nr:PAN2-PAN3 deadenylation complex catalytic subunit PAN2-like [Tigriopus californicus]